MEDRRRREADRDGAALAAPQPTGRVDSAVGTGQNGARILQELGAGLGQVHASRQPQEQRRADFALKLLNLLA
ncbi:hypothetical protein D3C73_1342700 [compost metagenome]